MRFTQVSGGHPEQCESPHSRTRRPQNVASTLVSRPQILQLWPSATLGWVVLSPVLGGNKLDLTWEVKTISGSFPDFPPAVLR